MKQELNDTNLLNYLGKSPELKIIDFLIENKRTSWNITEIEQQGGIARSTLKAVIPKLLSLGLICIERSIGRSRLYMVNISNPIVSSLIRLSNQIDSVESMKSSAELKSKMNEKNIKITR
jgi:hypothetical protein